MGKVLQSATAGVNGAMGENGCGNPRPNHE